MSVNFAISEKVRKIFNEQLKLLDGSSEFSTYEEARAEAEAFAIREFRRMCDWHSKCNEVYKTEYADKKEDNVKNKWVFDIRPSEQLSKRKFIEFTFELFKKKIFKSYYFVFEQSGIDEQTLGQGLHFHSIVEFNSPSKGKQYFLQEIINFVAKHNLQDYIVSNCIEIKKITTNEYLQNRIAYMNPEQFGKGNDDKHPKWVMDQPFRIKHDLEKSYSSAGCPLLQAQ